MKLLKSISLEQKHSTRFYQYFFSYVIVTVILLLIFSGVVYGGLFTSLQNEVETSNITTLLQLRDIIDTRLREMERITAQITSNYRLTPSMIGNGGYDALQAVKEVRNYYNSTTFVFDIVVFYKYYSDRIITASSYYSVEEFFNRVYKYEHFNKDDFLNVISSMETPEMRPVEKIAVNSEKNISFASYICPVPPNTSTPYGVVMFIIEEKTLGGLIENILQNHSGSVYILDKDDRPIIQVSKGSDLYDPQDMLTLINTRSEKKTLSTVRTPKGEYSIINVPSQYNEWSYVATIPTEQFMDKMYNVRKIFNLVILFILILGLSMAFLFASNTYKPIRNLARNLKGRIPGRDLSNYNDEIAFITKTFDHVTNENHNLMHKLKSKSYMLRENFILNLLKGKYKSLEEMEIDYSLSGVTLEDAYISVLLFLIDDYNNFKVTNTKSNQDLLIFSMINVIEELSSEYGRGYAIDLLENSGVTLILCLQDGMDENQAVREIAFRTKEFFKSTFDFTLTVGSGNIYDNPLQIQQSFVEANRAVYYRFLKGNDSIIFYKDLSRSAESNKYKYPVALESELITTIKQGKGNEIENITKKLMNWIVDQSSSPQAVQCICFGIINTVLKTLDEMDASIRTGLDKDIESLFSQQLETVETLKNKMIQFGQKICYHIENQKDSKNFALRDKILDYVQENYTDQNISLEAIADKFLLSPSYITNFFKEQTGYPLMKYIDNLRMQKVKELLKATKYNLKEIRERVGYIDETNFIRKFKKYEGVTPGQYRDLVSGTAENRLENLS